LWENIDNDERGRNIRKIISFVIIGVLLIVSFLIIYVLTKLKLEYMGKYPDINCESEMHIYVGDYLKWSKDAIAEFNLNKDKTEGYEFTGAL
jgi:hypothetical protein